MVRERIIGAAMEAMEESGIRFTMSDLAAKLAVSKRTLYEYFSSKEELIGVIVDNFLADLDQQLESVAHDKDLTLIDKVKAIQQIYPMKYGLNMDRALSDIRQQFPDEWAKAERLRRKIWNVVEEILQKAISANYLRPVNPAIIRILYDGITDHLSNSRFLAQNNLTMHDLIAILGDIILYGLVTSEHREDDE